MKETTRNKIGWALAGIGAVTGYVAGSIALINGVTPATLTVMVTAAVTMLTGLGLADAL